VLGRAGYGDYLAVYQGVTVGSDLEGNYPQLHEGVVLFGGARVIGRAHLGANTWVAPAAVVLDQSFPPDSVLFGMPPSTERRPSRRDVVRDFFRAPAARRPSPSAREGTV
jgi:serine O-acetyltransferase